MKIRETIFDKDYFDKWVDYDEKRISEMLDKLSDNTSRINKMALYKYSIFRKYFELLILKYSQGEKISVIREFFPKIIKALENYRDEPSSESFDFDGDFDDYIWGLWLVSFGIIFEISQEEFFKLVNLIENQGKDALYDNLINRKSYNSKISNELLYPRQFSELYKCISSNQEEQKVLINEYLKKWYSRMKNAYWHNNHLGPDGGGFFGYWSFEVAGVVKAYNVDISEISENQYFPKDLLK